MFNLPTPDQTQPLRVGSLFSGYGGLDLAIEEVFGAKTIWFAEINEPVARVFSHHWPDAPNLGDITTIDWSTVPPVDILCGGFPCQDVSTVGKMAGLKPGTRSGLWAHMVAAIEVLQPEWVVIENVRGLLSAPAIRAYSEGGNDAHCNIHSATPTGATPRRLEPDPWLLGDSTPRPLRAAGAVLGDLADLGMDAAWIGLPASAIGAPHPRFRIFVLAGRTAAHPARLRFNQGWREPGPGASTPRYDRHFPPNHRPRPTRALRLASMAERIGDVVDSDRRNLHRWGKYADAIARWEHITGHEAPAPALFHETGTPRPAPAFLEWLMGLDTGWVVDSSFGLSVNQQITALGNGVLPLQADLALRALAH